MNTELVQRLKSLQNKVVMVRAYRDMMTSQSDSLDKEATGLRYNAELHQKCTEIFKTWLEDSLEQNVNSIADLATEGLRHVMFDQDLTFRIQQDPKLNRLYMKFILEEKDSDGEVVEGNPTDSFGGGAVVIISLIMRLAVMARMGMGNLLVLDESLFALAQIYVPSAGTFIRQLSEETGVNILMVTHNEGFLNHAHIAYEGHKDGSLKLRRLKTSE